MSPPNIAGSKRNSSPFSVLLEPHRFPVIAHLFLWPILLLLELDNGSISKSVKQISFVPELTL